MLMLSAGRISRVAGKLFVAAAVGVTAVAPGPWIGVPVTSVTELIAPAAASGVTAQTHSFQNLSSQAHSSQAHSSQALGSRLLRSELLDPRQREPQLHVSNSLEARGHTTQAPNDLWEAPLGSPLRVTRAFDLKNGPYRAGHRGIDLPATVGEMVRAPVDGEVSFVGVVVDRPLLSLRVDAETVVSFEAVSSDLKIGDHVHRGDAIARVEPHHCETTCLHVGVRVNDEYVNPMRFFRARPQLLPW